MPKKLREIENGTRKTVCDQARVYYDGYWILYYEPPQDTWAAKKQLIDSLTRRLFHHTEPGINTPGEKLDVAQRAYNDEKDLDRKRVNGAMLAGALFNRAIDILTVVVQLEAKGVHISADGELMKQCSEFFQGALELGNLVKHYSGQEEIEELWGEPFRAFVMPIERFYESRYIKLAQTMHDIDTIAARLENIFKDDDTFVEIIPGLRRFSDAAKSESETLRRDPLIFKVWPRFVAAGEELEAFEPMSSGSASELRRHEVEAGVGLIKEAKALITYLSSARVPMPKSTWDFLQKCDEYQDAKEGR